MQLPDWLQAILKIGVPGAIAVFLVWRLAGGFDVIDARIKSAEDQHGAMLIHSARLEEAIQRASLSSDRVLGVLRLICVQNASSASDRRECLRDN